MVLETALVLYIAHEHEAMPISEEDRMLVEVELSSADFQVLSFGRV